VWKLYVLVSKLSNYDDTVLLSRNNQIETHTHVVVEFDVRCRGMGVVGFFGLRRFFYRVVAVLLHLVHAIIGT
jgi:hypothetical protein